MKKGIVTIILTISFWQFSFAQTSDEWQRQMEAFQQRMQEMAEQMKQLGGNYFFFDTTLVQPFQWDGAVPADSNWVRKFEFHHFGDEFPFDTSMVKGFRWYSFGDEPMQLDTLFFKDFKNFGSEDFPNLPFGEEWSKNLSQMMEQLMQQFGNNGEGQPFQFREWRTKPEDKDSAPPAPRPAPQKKRKITTL